MSVVLEKLYNLYYYDDKTFSIHSLNYILKLKKAKCIWERSDYLELKSVIKKQASLFPNSKTFDYSQLTTKEGIMELQWNLSITDTLETT